MVATSVSWVGPRGVRGQATGANGDPNVFTPNLDNMAIAGTNFPSAVSGYPLCCPFRGTMLTGKYAHNHSVRLHEDRLDPSFKKKELSSPEVRQEVVDDLRAASAWDYTRSWLDNPPYTEWSELNDVSAAQLGN